MKVAKLKDLCRRKINKLLKMEYDYFLPNGLKDCIMEFQCINPLLQRQNFYKTFEENHTTFARFLWFKYSFYSHSFERDVLKIYTATSLFASWVRYNHMNLVEIDLIGCKYLCGNMSLGFSFISSNKLKENKLEKKVFTSQLIIPDTIKNQKSVRLIIINYDLIEDYIFDDPFFFGLNNGNVYNFQKTLKDLGLPGFVYKVDRWCNLLLLFFERVALGYDFYNLRNKQANQKDTITIMRFVKEVDHLSLNFKKLHKTNIVSESFSQYLKNFTSLEEAELNLIDLTNNQKKSVVKALNVNLKKLKIVFQEPINFLLYIGKKFENLHTLEVVFLGSKKENQYFDKLNKSDLSMFTSLKNFKFNCHRIKCSPSMLLDTILNILNSSRKVLNSFVLENYYLVDVDKIVDFFWYASINLQFISFKFVTCIKDEHIMKLVKNHSSDNEFVIKIESCVRITVPGLKDVISYIEEKNLKVKVNHDKNFEQ